MLLPLIVAGLLGAAAPEAADVATNTAPPIPRAGDAPRPPSETKAPPRAVERDAGDPRRAVATATSAEQLAPRDPAPSTAETATFAEDRFSRDPSRPDGPPNAPLVAGPTARPGEEPGGPRLPPPASKKRAAPRTWYGWQTITLGATGIAIAVVGVLADSALTLYGGLSLYAMGPLASHWAHDNFGRGLIAFGIGAGGPLIGAYLVGAVSVAGDERRVPSEGAVLAGALVGGVAALTADAVFLAWAKKPPLALAPTIRVTSDSSTFGFAGRF